MIYLYKNKHEYNCQQKSGFLNVTIRILNVRSTASTTFDDTIAE